MDKDAIIEQHLTHLRKLIAKRDSLNSKIYLESLQENIKGKVFEYFLADLYEGNGWKAQVMGGKNDKGADILIRHPKEPTVVQFILQVKNHKSPITKKDTQAELNQFIEEASPKYNCNQFRIISINGFVEDAFKYQRYNLRLENWQHVETLYKYYGQIANEEPEVGLHSHNKIAYQNLQKLWKTNKRVAIIQATGTGKSYIIFKVLSDFIGKRKILLTPSKAIQNQFRENSDYGWLIDSKTQTFLYHNNKKFEDENIDKLKADLIVLDEFHRIGAKKFTAKVRKLIEANPSAFILGTTATPIRYLDGKRDMCQELFDGIQASNLTLPRAIASKILPNPTYITSLISLDEDTQYYFSEIEKSKRTQEEKEVMKSEIERIKLNWEKSSGVPEILKRHLSGKNLSKFIVFCEGIDHLDEMKIEVESWFQKAEFRKREKFEVFSDLGLSTNTRTLEKFKNFNEPNTIVLLFAIDMLNEGVHISDVDGVILLRPTESPIVFYQQIGRCLQAGNKSPVIFDFVRNFSSITATNFRVALEEAREEERKQRKEDGVSDDTPEFNITDETKDIAELFDDIAKRLENWEFWFSLLVEYKKEHKNCDVKHKGLYRGHKLGFWCSNQRRKNANITTEQRKRLDELGFDWRDEFKLENNAFEDLLSEKLQWLLNYYNIQKTGIVPYREPKDPKKREGWSRGLANFAKINYKNTYKKRVESDPDKYTIDFNGTTLTVVEFLKKIEFEKNDKRDVLSEMKSRLKLEKDKNPNFGPEDFSNLIKTDKVFARDVNRIRNHMNDLDGYPKSYFPPGVEEELLRLGFVPPQKATDWYENYSELKGFLTTNELDDLNIKNNRLYHWCRRQIKNFQKGIEPPNKKQIEELKNINFNFNFIKAQSSKNERWEEFFEDLSDYKNTNGNTDVPSDSVEYQELYKWCLYQRNHKNRLLKSKIERLTSLGFSWERNVNIKSPTKEKKIVKVGRKVNAFSQEKWDVMFVKLNSYFQKYKTFVIEKSSKELTQLNSWVNTQRSLYKKKTIHPLRISKLNSIGFPWEVGSGRKASIKKIKPVKTKVGVDAWDINYLKLLNYKLENGNSNVPKNYHDKTLAQWVSRQRYLIRKKLLTKEQIDKLNLLEFQWVGLKVKSEKEIWMRTYEKLKAFFKLHGHSTVTKSHGDKQLVSWVLQQRYRRKRGKLKPEFIPLLDALKFDWNPESKGGYPDDEQWFEMLKELEAYKNKFGDCNVSQLDKVYRKLGRWLNDQRVNYSRNKLLKHRKELLDQLGVIWNTKEHEWNLKLQMLNSYYKKYSDFDVKQTDKNFPGLYNWIYKIKRNGTTKEKIQKLKDIGYDTTEVKTIEND